MKIEHIKKVSSGSNILQPLLKFKIKSKLYSYLENENYSGIFYILKEKGFIYVRELENITGNARYYLENLLKIDFIYRCNHLDAGTIEWLKNRKNLGDYHFKKMKIYKLTNLGKEFLSDCDVISYINENISDKFLSKIEDEKTDFINYNDVKQQKINQELEYRKLKYNIAKQKNHRLRTFEDNYLIEDFERCQK